MADKKTGFGWSNLLLGILFIITSLIAFNDPVGNLASLTVFFGIVAIIKGCFDIFIRNKIQELTGSKATMLVVLGILDIILGIVLLFNISLGVMTLPYIFAIWFIIDSVSGLFSMEFWLTESKAYYWFNLILNVIGVIVGFSLLFDPVVSALTLSFLVGFYLMMFGLINIVAAFRNS